MNNDKMRDIHLKNYTYYFDEIIHVNDLDLGNILLDEKSYENILIYVAYKTLYGAKPVRIIFDKLVGYIRKLKKKKKK